jgi:hypothetical protein
MHIVVCKEIPPWKAVVRKADSSPISCGDVLDAIYRYLQGTVTDHERHAIFSRIRPAHREECEVAYNSRIQRLRLRMPQQYRRIDFLGRKVYWLGLTRVKDGDWQLHSGITPPGRPSP